MATAAAGVTSERSAPRSLLRVLGASFAIAIAIGATIGGGILRTPGNVAAELPNVKLYLLAWVLGGVNALFGASAFAELGAMIPRSGGLYVFARRAFGEGLGFFLGYTDWLTLAVSTAALLLLIGEYTTAVIPVVRGYPVAVGIAAFVVLVACQWRGVGWGARVQEFTSAFKTIALVGLVVAIFVLSKGPMPAATTTLAVPSGLALIGAFGVAMQGVVFTYDSYYSAVYCGEEIRDPGRQLPRSIFRALWLIIAIYLSLNIAFITVVPIARMANDPFVGATVARWVFGARGDSIIRGLMIISVLGTANAILIQCTRILHAMSRDRLFPRAGDYVNAGGTPSVTLAVTAAVVLAFLFTGSFNAVLGLSALLMVTRYVVVFAALFALRRKEPNAERPYRAIGYPWLPGLALTLALVFLATNAVADVRTTLIVAGLLLVSWPASRLATRREQH